MKIGVNILNFGAAATPSVLERWAMETEGLGYHFVMISDHVAITPDVASRFPTPFYDPFIVLAWLAGATKKVELGTSVTILPYRHPLHTARMAANIDHLSGGRFLFGVGVGWAQQEFAALGIPFHRRGALTDEYLAVIKQFWTQDIISYSGKSLMFQDVHTGPRPRRSPHPPIWVGGSSEAAMRRVLRFGDAWHPLRFRVDWMKSAGLPRLREMADAAGTNIPALCPRIFLRVSSSALDDDQRMAGEGTLDQIRRDFDGLAAMGAEYVLLDSYAPNPETARTPELAWKMLETLAEQIFDLDGESLR